jgi:hypothetical protein
MIRARAMYRVTTFLLAAGTLFGASDARAWDNGVALTPPLGWNSWNKFGCNASEGFDQVHGGWNGGQRYEGCWLSIRGD